MNSEIRPGSVGGADQGRHQTKQVDFTENKVRNGSRSLRSSRLRGENSGVLFDTPPKAQRGREVDVP
jgi:hypothetical protein